MFNITKDTQKTKLIATVSIFTALYAILRIIPTVPMIGASGASFSLSDIVAPLYGLILGPYIGGLSVIIGSLIAFFGKPPVFMGLDFLPATVAAFSAGLLVKRKWIYAIGLNVVLLAAFLIHPNTSVFVDYSIGSTTFTFPFAWLHIIAFIVLISPLGRKVAQWIKTNNTTRITIAVAILFFVGTMMQHLMGNLLYETIMAQPIGHIPVTSYPANWLFVFPLYPIERSVLVVFGTIIGTSLVKVLKNTSLFPEE
jgi:uncharacterized membrane protein